ncbi:MAG: polyphosphate polymerase domain-containing protein [Candidatus Marinimicrobia bacterium]|nr:polyphosphate polymerase domain-containing protein [Candidatus Neomarinimicrobiota bacterium]MCF7829572.1 polyphosphate polymerase domain-containing protein [Candidatus Neomarinimicrobiota bacterium]MCF7882022.1 polyphosphate polymerase domain-containing protein [Candidatus Neomarinimicrobiota bacterium]
MGRLEYKYLIPENRLDEIREYIRPYVKIDPYAKRTGDDQYTVKSIYFDTMSLDAYYNKLSGIKVRKKFRIRGYDAVRDDSLTFLEIKRKDVNVISKNRAPVLRANLKPLLNTGDIEAYVYTNNGVQDPAGQAMPFLYYYTRRDLRPAIKVIYDREAFVYKFDRNLRITFDKVLRSSLDTDITSMGDESGTVKALKGHFIMEVKTFTRYPTWLRYLIAELDITHEALSKYTICINSHRRLGKRIHTNGVHLRDNKLRKTSRKEPQL